MNSTTEIFAGFFNDFYHSLFFKRVVETYIEPSQASKTELPVKIVNS